MNTHIKFRNLLALAVVPIAIAQFTPMAAAAVIVDNSPDAIGALTPKFTADNSSSNQNFLVQFTLQNKSVLNGFDIYSDFLPALKSSVLIKIRNDVNGAPNSSNISSVSSNIATIDSIGSTANPSIQRIHSDFASTTLDAGTYWIGMSGINDSIGWNVEFNRPSTAAWQLSGDDLRFSFHNNAAFAFRVEGVSGAVPEPTTWTMLLLGFGMIGFAMRKRSNVRTTVSYA